MPVFEPSRHPAGGRAPYDGRLSGQRETPAEPSVVASKTLGTGDGRARPSPGQPTATPCPRPVRGRRDPRRSVAESRCATEPRPGDPGGPAAGHRTGRRAAAVIDKESARVIALYPEGSALSLGLRDTGAGSLPAGVRLQTNSFDSPAASGSLAFRPDPSVGRIRPGTELALQALHLLFRLARHDVNQGGASWLTSASFPMLAHSITRFRCEHGDTTVR